MPIAFANVDKQTCPCGCGQVFSVFTGNLDYASDSSAIFQAAHLKHADDPHVWLLFRTGPWVRGDPRDCWVTLHLYLRDQDIVTVIADPQESPLWPTRSQEHRYLTRSEVLQQPGGKEWVIERRLEFEEQHRPTHEFLNESAGASPATSDVVICTVCGRTHDKAESELYFQMPDEVYALSEEERDRRSKGNSDLWVLDEKRFYVRGLLPLPVAGRAKPYCIGVWALVSPQTFTRINELWSDPAQAGEPRLPGVLSNQIPFHAETTDLGLEIELTGPKTRPNFFLKPIEHPLFAEQSRGIDEHRALEYSDRSARESPCDSGHGAKTD